MTYAFYIYALVYEDEVCYVGASRNPAARLMDHLNKPQNHALHDYLSTIEDPSEVLIKILGVVKSKSIRISQAISEKENFWISYYKQRGHNLMNICIRSSPKV